MFGFLSMWLVAQSAAAQEAAPPAPRAPAEAPPPRAPAEAPPATAPAPEPTAASTANTVTAPTANEVRYRRLSVDVASSSPDAVLERRVTTKESTGAWLVIPTRSNESTWEQVCIAPCVGTNLDRYSTYRVAATNGIAGSSPFTLPQGADALHLRLDTGSLAAHRAGMTMGAIGGAALIVGVTLLAVAPTLSNPGREHDYRVAGWVTGGAGLVLLAVGIPLSILTSTRVYSGDTKIAAPSKGPRFIGNGVVF
jgi:hypothetical protein